MRTMRKRIARSFGWHLVKLICVPPHLKHSVWPLVADRLNRAYLKTDLGHTADLERDVLDGHADLWLAATRQ
jgi:hypothetical protein